MPRSRRASISASGTRDTVTLEGSVPDAEVLELTGHGYDLVVAHLTKAQHGKLII
jgi:predicted DNA-binding protein (MmcQ/YjbR family)